MYSNIGKSSRLGVCAFFAILMISEEAIACRSPSSFRTIFFDEVPTAANVQAIARITITKVTGPRAYVWAGAEFSYEGLAYVESVIKGPIPPAAVIKIDAPNSTCDIPFRVGEKGIVLGNLKQDEQGMWRLYPKSQYVDPDMRKQDAILDPLIPSR
jgi:hypothetical protein